MSDFVTDFLWWKADLAGGLDSDLWRLDCAGRLMYRYEHGDRNSPYGWEKGHIVARVDGGSDSLFNLQAEHWQTNLEKEKARQEQIRIWGLATLANSFMAGTQPWLADSPPGLRGLADDSRPRFEGLRLLDEPPTWGRSTT